MSVDGAHANLEALNAKQEFQIWKSTTSTLALKWTEDKKGRARINTFVGFLFAKILNDIRPFVRTLIEEEILNNLREVLCYTIDLDQEICKQAARVDWIFPTQQNQL
jgi:hypothetical protein